MVVGRRGRGLGWMMSRWSGESYIGIWLSGDVCCDETCE
jgi:hypothetical protein